DAYAGEGAVRGDFHLLLGGRAGSADIGFLWSATGGVMLRGSGNPHTFRFGGGAAVTLARDRINVGPEVYGATQLGGSPLEVPGTGIKASSSTNLEILGGAKLRVSRGLFIGVAAGPGPVNAIGTPVLRAVFTVGWAPPPEAPPPVKPVVIGDKDGDGIRDDID